MSKGRKLFSQLGLEGLGQGKELEKGEALQGLEPERKRVVGLEVMMREESMAYIAESGSSFTQEASLIGKGR